MVFNVIIAQNYVSNAVLLGIEEEITSEPEPEPEGKIYYFRLRTTILI